MADFFGKSFSAFSHDDTSYPHRKEGSSLIPHIKSVRDLSLWSLWVNPEHQVRTALIIMKGHGVSALGVLDKEEYVGVVCLEDLVSVPEDCKVEEVMRREIETVELNTPLNLVAELMSRKKLSRLPVVESGRFYGIISAHDLLHELGRNFDPLTRLPWSDSLREWGINNLRQGKEISIIFIDLDNYGVFNKQFGHIVGDQVLETIAELLRSLIDPALEHLCRYAGDEFAIGTLRPRAEAEKLAKEIKAKIDSMRISSVNGSVSASVGVQGGRRTKERKDIHYAATVDNLINLASKSCTASKPSSKPEVKEVKETTEENTHPPKVHTPPRLVALNVGRNAGIMKAVAVLETEIGFIPGVHVGASQESFAAAAAVAEALKELFPNAGIRLLEVMERRAGADSRQVTVLAEALGKRITGSARVTHTVSEAAAEATLEAIFGSCF
ncbi:MAG TPA: CBS domain-containing protein [Fimbriimonadales bacterium]|nr:CBS domain-containing protein [Fimbriimonadales bacterium]